MQGGRLSAVAFHKRLAGKTAKEKELLVAEEAKLAKQEDAYLADLCGLWDGYLQYKDKEADQSARKRKLVAKKSSSALVRVYRDTIKQFLAVAVKDAKETMKEEIVDNTMLKAEVDSLEEEVSSARTNLQSLRASQDENAVRALEFELQQQRLQNRTKQRYLDMRKHILVASLKASEEILDHCKWTALKERVAKVDESARFTPRKVPEIPEDPVRTVWIQLERQRLEKMRAEVDQKREYALQLEQQVQQNNEKREHELAQMTSTLTSLYDTLRVRREAQTQLAQLQNENVRLQFELDNVREEALTVRASQRAADNDATRLEDLKVRHTQAQGRCTDLQAQIESKRSLLSTKRAKNAAMQRKIDTCRHKLSEYQRKLALKDKKIDLIQQQITQVFNGTYRKPAPRQRPPPPAPVPKAAKQRVPLALRTNENEIANHPVRSS